MSCQKCGGKLLLGETYITQIQPDAEPYKPDEVVEKEDIDLSVFLNVYYCENCGIIHDIWDDENEHLPKIEDENHSL